MKHGDTCRRLWLETRGRGDAGEDPRPLSRREVTPERSWPARPGKHPEGASESSPGLASYLKHPQPPKMSSENWRRERVRLKSTGAPHGLQRTRAVGAQGRTRRERLRWASKAPRADEPKRESALPFWGALTWGDPRVTS